MSLNDSSAPPSDARQRGWNALELIVEHGWTALFLSVTAVVARIENADLALRSFAGRVVSPASADAYDVGARNSLYGSSILLLVLLFCAALVALRLLRRVSAQHTNEVLEALSVGGCVLWLARAYALPNAPLIGLIVAALATTALAGLLDRWLLRAANAPERGTWMALVGVGAIGIATVLQSRFDKAPLVRHPEFLEWFLAALGIALHVALRVACLRRDEEARAAATRRAAWAIAPLGWLPLVWVLRDELYLTANNREWHALQPGPIEAALLAALALWCGWRWLRAGAAPDMGRALGSLAFPALAVSLSCFAHYRHVLGPQIDLFEPGNPTLFIQQWLDFGRVPFVETFNAHALSDSFFGFVYAAIHGAGDDNWRLYDFLGEALSTLVIYVALRRLTGNAFVGFFVAALLPFRTELTPNYCDLALTTMLVLAWLVERPSALRWIAFAFYSVALFLWRLDMGFASLAASGALLVALSIVRSDFRPRLAHIAGAGALCALVYGGAFFAIAYARGVDPLARLEDLRHVLQSNQGFGHVEIARTLNANVLLNLSVIPLAVLALTAWVLVRLRRSSAPQAPFKELFIVWAAVYYFVNFPRGLVRHSWIEVGNVYALSFALTALSSAVLLRAWRTERLRAAAFLGSASVLAGSFGVFGPLPERADKYHRLWTNWRASFLRAEHIKAQPEVIDRTPTSPQTERDHYAEFREFVAANLGPEQTFVDLQHAPLLYSDTRRRSPHYLNHIYLAHDEHLQLSEIAEFERNDIPLAVVWTEDDLAKRDGVKASRHNVPDAVFNHVRQWRLHEWLNARYEPWRLVQRWQVWRRTNWIAPTAPQGEDERLLAAQSAPLDSERKVRLAPAEGASFELTAERTAYLRVRGRNAAAGELLVRITFAGDERPIVRELRLPEGPLEHCWTLPASSAPRSVAQVEFDFGAARECEVSEVALLDVTAPAYSDILPRATRWRPLLLRWLPWVWGSLDPDQAQLRPLVRSIWPPKGHEVATKSFELSARSAAGFENGVNGSKAAVLIDELDPPLAPGDRVRFAASGERTVRRVADGEVSFTGPPLDPVRDGRPNAVERLELSAAARAANRMLFEPLEDGRKPCFLVLELAAPTRRAKDEERTGVLQFGAGEVNLGRIDFNVKPGVHTYVFPTANEYNWARSTVDWISFHGPGGGIRATRVTLVEGH